MNFIDWIQNNWATMLEAIAGVLVTAGIITGFFNGPRADQAKSILDRILAMIRGLGIGTYKDEPGTGSLPFAPDSGKRIASTEDA